MSQAYRARLARIAGKPALHRLYCTDAAVCAALGQWLHGEMSFEDALILSLDSVCKQKEAVIKDLEKRLWLSPPVIPRDGP